MITYTISIHDSGWQVQRHGEKAAVLNNNLTSEHDAISLAIQQAKEEGNAEIIRTTPAGDRTVIARFGDLASHTIN